MIITVMVYKSSGSTSCRGCIMDQWDSDYDMRSFDDIDKASKWVSEYYCQNKINKLGEYEITYFINGISYNGYDFDGEWLEEYDTYDYSIIKDKAMKLADDKYEVYKDKQMEERYKREQAERERQTQRDLIVLAELKEKYGE